MNDTRTQRTDRFSSYPRLTSGRARPPWFRTVGQVLGVLLALLLGVVVVVMLGRAFIDDGSLTVQPVRDVANLNGIGTSIRNTVLVVGGSAVMALVIGTALAWANERTDAQLGMLGDIFPLAPLMLPKVAVSIGWVFLAAPVAGYINVVFRGLMGIVGIDAGRTGPLDIYSWYGLIFLFTIEFVPYSFLMMSTAFRNMDASLEDAARISGDSPVRVLVSITLPAMRPAIGAAFFIMMVSGASVFSIPTIVGTQAGIDMLSVRIVRLVRGSFPPQTSDAVALSLVLLAIVAAAWTTQLLISRGGRHVTVGGRGYTASRVRLGVLRWPVRCFAWLLFLLLGVVPFAALLLVSLQPFWSPDIDLSSLTLDGYREVFDTPLASAAIRNSIELGLITASIAVVVVSVVLIAARELPSWQSRSFEGVLRLPSTLSPIMLAVGILMVFGGPPLSLAGSGTILIIAYFIVYLPHVAISVEAAFRQVGQELDESSRVAGVPPGRTFAYVHLPLVAAGLGMAWALMFVHVAGDLTASAMLGGPREPVVGFVILDIWENGIFPELAAISTVISVITAIVVCSALAIARRGKWRQSDRRLRRALPGGADSEATSTTPVAPAPN